jgi:hypothetical protein
VYLKYYFLISGKLHGEVNITMVSQAINDSRNPFKTLPSSSRIPEIFKTTKRWVGNRLSSIVWINWKHGKVHFNFKISSLQNTVRPRHPLPNWNPPAYKCPKAKYLFVTWSYRWKIVCFLPYFLSAEAWNWDGGSKPCGICSKKFTLF